MLSFIIIWEGTQSEQRKISPLFRYVFSSEKGYVNVSMLKYVNKIIDTFPDKIWSISNS